MLFQVPDPDELVGTTVDDAGVVRARARSGRPRRDRRRRPGRRAAHLQRGAAQRAGRRRRHRGHPDQGRVRGIGATRSAHACSRSSIATLLALAIALAFAHLSVIRRIRDLVTMTRRIGAGDLTARSHVTSSDEIGELGRSLDSMADELRIAEIERGQLMTRRRRSERRGAQAHRRRRPRRLDPGHVRARDEPAAPAPARRRPRAPGTHPRRSKSPAATRPPACAISCSSCTRRRSRSTG